MVNKRGFNRSTLLVLLIIVLLVAVYFTFFFSYNCKDIGCFKAHQEECSRTKFVNDANDITWEYSIKGNEGGLCEIDVKILQVKKGDIDRIRLEGESMTCYLPLGDTTSPEADINKCNGQLKEDLQNIIIKNLHSYIIENIGEITEELNRVV